MEIKLVGEWDEGYALSMHTISSTYVGEDPFGHAKYNTIYTPLGQLVYSMKYNGHFDTSDKIISMASEFLQRWLNDKRVECVIPVPSSKERYVQPVNIIAEKISHLIGAYYCEDVLQKLSSQLTKNVAKEERDLSGQIVMIRPAKRQCNVLLVDDLYSSGATAKECVHVLRQDKNIQKIYFLSITKTR